MPRFHAIPTCTAIACLALSACTVSAPSPPMTANPAIASINRDAELLALCDDITKAQRSEIDQMESIRSRLD